ncbi:MAG TPA: GlxA family transcriptional regulator [Caulobacteraceae bacterium]
MTRRVAVVIFEGLQILDAAGPIAAFEIAERFVPGSYALEVRAVSGGSIASSAGAGLFSAPLGEPAGLDTVLVVGGEGTRSAMHDETFLAWVRAAASQARRTASVCSGAFVLAAAGLLDGRRATTHWSRAAGLARHFPAVRVEPDRIWVRDGRVWTSAGITAGIDLCLALVAEDLGEAVAREVARQLVVYYRRPGGQSQFSALTDLARAEGRFAGLLTWARENLDERLDVERLAAHCAMSPRHFARAFAAETGVTPAKAIERLRLEAARARLSEGPASLDRIARETGFSDADHMRRAFIRAFGQPPQAMRRLAA